MEIRIASIIIWNEKAYISTPARYVDDGLFTEIEPVYEVNPTQSELLSVIQVILSKNPEVLPVPAPDDIKARRDLLPRITGARNWKRLCQNGISYVIELSEKGFLLEMSRLDRKGRWEYDPDKHKTYPRDTSLEAIIRDVLNDLAERSQVSRVRL